jgi:Fe-Mn family superoxide dismutase
MRFQLPELPYKLDELEPFISARTMEFHFYKHHKSYIDKTNHLLEAPTAWQDELTLEEVVQTSTGALFNNAAQAWNHCFFWHCLRPSRKAEERPTGELALALDASFGSYDRFRQVFTSKATELFGSGYVWVIKDRSRRLSIVTSTNAETPIVDGYPPILALDVWEHAYYLDYQNERQKFVEGFWHIVNWDYVSQCLVGTGIPSMTKHMSANTQRRPGVAAQPTA